MKFKRLFNIYLPAFARKTNCYELAFQNLIVKTKE